ncbi:MAG TPA: hypothetical protein VHL57_12250 [Flavobacteriales bacterium]|nr:hypothetical protein [Flavobacteriales bacterium]
MALALILGSAALALFAQGEDPSLTKDFPKLSPKERSRIAAKETAEAQQDAVYQAVMHEAELAFQEGRYEDALANYEKARNQRPYNVYPKVKIQDLKALLKRKEEEAPATEQASGTPAVVEPVKEEPMQPPPPVIAAPPLEKPAVQNAPPPVAKPVEKPAERPVKPKEPAPRTEARPAPPRGMEERRYQEGHAWVIERTINVEGRRVVYKRVAHPFGQVFFFEDGIAVDERVWNARFP